MRRLRPIAASAVLAALAAGLLALAACGVPLDQEPRAINQTTIAPATTSVTIASPGDATVPVYFLNRDTLQAQEQPVEGDITLGAALDAVLAPPDEAGDLRTAIPPGTALRGVEVADGLATIDLSSEINDIGGSAQKQAFAQIVFTALGFDEVQDVRFLIDGKAIDAPTDDGNLSVVSAANYDPPLNPR
ncbi:MAG: Lipoprotein LpqB, GerMN domain protein [Ilumatobacteraceae bacterium]|nr:Lipoprotein LpqB, GerMN domain protein [Ilumatobacteraceae bacterium]